MKGEGEREGDVRQKEKTKEEAETEDRHLDEKLGRR